MACDNRQLSQTQRESGYQNGSTGVVQAIRPFTGRATIENLIDYLNRELVPVVRSARSKVNDTYLRVRDNAPSGNPLQFYFSEATADADPSEGRLRLNDTDQHAATRIIAQVNNARLQNVAPWFNVMAGSVTEPLGTVTLSHATNPNRFLRADLTSMANNGVFWDLVISPIEGAPDENPFVDGDEVVLSFIPGVASQGTTVPGTAIGPADGPRQFLATSTAANTVDFRTLSAIFPGAPIYDVMAYPFNASGSLAGDDTAAINAAIAAANAAPGVIYLGSRHRITAALTTITNNNIRIIGRGAFNGGTILQVDSPTNIDVFTFFLGQYCSLENLWIVGARIYTGGWAVKFDGTYRAHMNQVVITNMCFGVEILNTVFTDIKETHLSDLYGVFGFLAHGSGGFYNHAVRFEQCVCGTDYPAAVVGAASVWASGHAYVIGNIVFSNSAIYQAISNGTSGATAPSGSGTTPGNAHSTTISDGGVNWVFAMPLMTWFLQDSYAHTFEVIDCGTLQGGTGLAVSDSAPGSGSTPLFTRVQNLQIDHPFTSGITLSAGAAARMNQVFVTSVLEGSGIVIGSGCSGGWEFVGGEVFGTAKAGMTVAASDGIIADMTFASIGLTTTNTRDGIEVTNGADRFTIANCHIGTATGATDGHRYGISVASGSDNYVIEGNRLLGSLTGPLLNTPGQATTRVLRNNIPNWAHHVASDSRETFNLAPGSYKLTLAATTTEVLVNPTSNGAVIITGISHGAGNAGVEVTIRKEGTDGWLELRDNNTDSDSIWTPASATYFLHAYNDAALLRHMTDGGGFARWRISNVPRYTVRVNSGATDYVRRRLNLIPGTGITITPVDDPTDQELDVTIAATAGSTSTITLTGISGNQGTVNISTLDVGGTLIVSSPAGAYQFEGFTAKTDGFWFRLALSQSEVATLFYEDATATSTNRMVMLDALDIVGAGIQGTVFYANSRWRVIAEGGAGRLIARTVYLTGSGTHTYNLRTRRAVVRMKGGGGAGGGIEGGGTAVGAAAGGGGGAGADLRLDITAVPTSSAYAIGAGGTGATADVGGNGGDTTFHDGSATRTAPGGSGGGLGTLSATPVAAYGGDGGTLPSATGAFWRGKGDEGAPGYAFNLEGTPWGNAGNGGVGYEGCGAGRGVAFVTGSSNGGAASGPGAGGGGGLSLASTTDRAGGNGSPGIVIVEEYS